MNFLVSKNTPLSFLSKCIWVIKLEQTWEHAGMHLCAFIAKYKRWNKSPINISGGTHSSWTTPKWRSCTGKNIMLPSVIYRLLFLSVPASTCWVAQSVRALSTNCSTGESKPQVLQGHRHGNAQRGQRGGHLGVSPEEPIRLWPDGATGSNLASSAFLKLRDIRATSMI